MLVWVAIKLPFLNALMILFWDKNIACPSWITLGFYFYWMNLIILFKQLTVIVAFWSCILLYHFHYKSPVSLAAFWWKIETTLYIKGESCETLSTNLWLLLVMTLITWQNLIFVATGLGSSADTLQIMIMNIQTGNLYVISVLKPQIS